MKKENKKEKGLPKGKPIDRFANFIVEHKYIVLSIFVTLCIVGLVCFFFVRVNSDITAYLPQDSATAIGQDFLRENFDMDGDFLIVVKNPTATMDEGKVALGNRISAINELDHVTDVMWVGAASFDTIKIVIGEEQYKNITDILYRDNCFVMIATIDISSSSDEAFAILDQCSEILEGEEFTLGGSVASSKQIFDETLNSMPIFLAIAIAVVLIILLLTTSSWLEPFILLAAIGVAILINMGTNIIFPSVSVITQACGAILQIGLTMDFAIFLMHSYHNAMDKTHDAAAAMKIAIPKTLATISASALTTIGGFVALCFMRMTFGMDLAKVLIKGIIISLMTIIMLQPVLTLMLKTPLAKGKHKYINYSFKTPIRISVKLRYVFGVICLAVIGVCCWAQTNLQYSYMKLQVKTESATVTETISDNMSNQIIIAVPSTDIAAQYPFIDEIKSIDNITSVMGLYAFVPYEYATIISRFESLTASFNKNGFTMYSIQAGAESETAEGDALLADLTNTLKQHFGQNFYISGTSQAVADLEEITPFDLKLVSILSAAIIGFILLLALRSFKKTLIVLLLIMGGIWINLTIFMLVKKEINFITVIVINAIQLGATVDYAILMSTTFKDYRKRGFSPIEAARASGQHCTMSILTSAMILIGACMSVFLVSKNVIIAEITAMIALGAALSAVMVVFILPGMLAILERNFIFCRSKNDKPIEVETAIEDIGIEVQLANMEHLMPTTPNKKKYRKLIALSADSKNTVAKKERKAVKKLDRKAAKKAEKAVLEKLSQDIDAAAKEDDNTLPLE